MLEGRLLLGGNKMHNDGMQVTSDEQCGQSSANRDSTTPGGRRRDRLQDPERRVDHPLLHPGGKWIAKLWAIPEGKILKQGRHILMAYLGHQAVGCVALIPMGDGVYELSKMAVSPEMRGLGIGRRLLLHAIAQAKRIGARSLFLGSNCQAAKTPCICTSPSGFAMCLPKSSRHALCAGERLYGTATLKNPGCRSRRA